MGKSSWEDMGWGWGDRIHPGYPRGESIHSSVPGASLAPWESQEDPGSGLVLSFAQAPRELSQLLWGLAHTALLASPMNTTWGPTLGGQG